MRISVAFQAVQTPGPTAVMSATVRMVRSFRRSRLCTIAAKRSMVFGSERSRLWAVIDISRWCSTSQDTISVSAWLRPKRGLSFSAMAAPAIEWSSGRPLAMSWSRMAT